MTLYKQIAILVSLIFVILFFTIMSVSFSITKESAQKELYENAQNSVTSLSISITNTDTSIANIETMINAVFDNGNYESIVYKDGNGIVVYERLLEEKIQIVPSWFENLTTLNIPVAKSTLSSGWQVIGTLEIISDKEVVYMQLYGIMTQVLKYLVVLCIVFLIFLGFMIHLILRPLNEIEQQAIAVMNDEFIIQERQPWTKEFRILTATINKMVKKFESIFKTASSTLSENKELLYIDNITKIPNRKYFVLKAKEYLTQENINNHGLGVIISIKKADLLNQTIGYQNTDKLFFDFAQYLQLLIKGYEDSIVCRTNGTEFIILLPRKTIDDIALFTKDIFSYIDNQLKIFNLNQNDFGINIGVARYSDSLNLGEFFTILDYSLSQAKLILKNEHYTLIDNNILIGKDKWRQIFQDALENDKFDILYRKTVNSSSKKEIHNTLSFALNYENKKYYYGTLIAPIVELGLTKDIYLYILKKVLQTSSNSNIPLSIQISSQFIEDINVYENLKKLFETIESTQKANIILELPETTINKHYEKSLLYIRLFKEYGFGFGINSFIADSEDYVYLKELKPLFVKSDKQYLLDTDQNINVLKIVLDSLGVNLIATGVSSLAEIEKLQSKGIELVSGMIVDSL
ncbi:MAG: LapD/MoxY N-terminal periplasmic domain-containing protein [Arcobacteraceae bacterium]|jgi:diguanylate cyclase (GGDEF)-like protein|nr:LapD/MoxY N-terminal periplasmic domain-containing protein [Arcobacteraceae bacterium]